MRIAMVSAHANPLTEPEHPHAAHVHSLSAALVRCGHTVTVHSRRDAQRLPDRVRTDHGYEVVHVPAGPATRLADERALPHMGDFTSFVLAEWAKVRPDVVHGHFWPSGIVSALAGQRLRLPVVQTFYSLEAAERRETVSGTDSARRNKLERLACREAAHVTAGSSGEVANLVESGLRRTRISVVPAGVDLDAFTSEGRQARRGRLHRLVTVGPLLPYRGVDVIITSLSKVDDAELVIVGRPVSGSLSDDPEAKRLRALAEELGVVDRVVFAGRVKRSELPALLRSADIAVCAPAYDPYGTAALEAMACGVPVVATSVGGLADIVLPGVTGLLVPPRQPISLVRALRSLLADDTLRNEFAVAGQDRVRARYSWDRIALDMLRVYQHAGTQPDQPTVAECLTTASNR